MGIVEKKEEEFSDWFHVNVGFPQGSKCSPLGFNSVQDAVLRRSVYILHENIHKRNLNKAWEELDRLNDILAFADDTLVISENLFDLRKAVSAFDTELRKLGVRLNQNKSQFLTNI